MTIAEIRELLAELPVDPSIDDWYRVRRRLDEELTQRIRRMQDTLVELRSEVKLCEMAPVSRQIG